MFSQETFILIVKTEYVTLSFFRCALWVALGTHLREKYIGVLLYMMLHKIANSYLVLREKAFYLVAFWAVCIDPEFSHKTKTFNSQQKSLGLLRTRAAGLLPLQSALAFINLRSD